MNKKFLSFILAIVMVVSCTSVLSACQQDPPPEDPPTGAVYTVTEEEWEINFNITKSETPSQSQPLCASSNKDKQQLFSSTPSIAEITSYTLRAEGTSQGQDGMGILKVAPNGMEMEFYLGGVLRPGETGKTPSGDPWYIGMTTMLKSFFPFSGQYDEFTFDATKNAYVAENLKSTVVNESDINDTNDLFNKKVEISFINGYLSTVSIELTADDTYTDVFLSLVFTFSDINNTTVEI